MIHHLLHHVKSIDPEFFGLNIASISTVFAGFTGDDFSRVLSWILTILLILVNYSKWRANKRVNKKNPLNICKIDEPKKEKKKK